MHVHVDGARQNMQAGGVEGFARRRHGFVGADRKNTAVLDRDAADNRRVRRYDRAVANDQIGGHCGHLHVLTAWPSRRRPEDRRR